MTSATRSVAVVATRLPTTDRRALSQAWFSALHLPSKQGSVSSNRAHLSACATTPPHRATLTTTHSRLPAVLTRGTAAIHGQVGRATGTLERRLPQTELARRIEATAMRALKRRMTAAVAIAAGDGRVQLLIRTDGNTVRIVALCAPHLRERVDRALAAVRFHLVGTGRQAEVAR